MFAKKSLNFKLRASFAVMIVFLVAVGVIGIYSLKQVSKSYQHVAEINLQNAIELGEMNSSSREILRRMLQFQLTGNTEEDKKRLEDGIIKNREIYKRASKKYEDVPFVQGEAELYAKVESNWKEIDALIDKGVVLAKSNVEGDRIKFSDLYRGELKKSRDAFFEAITTLIEFQTKQSELWTKQAQAEAEKADMLTTIALIVGSIFAIIIAYTISHSLTSKLRNLSNNLSAGSNEVEKSSGQIAQASEELSQATTEQSASLEETSASIEEISSMINQNTESAKASAQTSESSLANAEKGKAVVEQMIHAIGDINTSNNSIMEQINTSNKEIQEIVKVIAEIGNKTKVINDIVFQTKLLSFNASVEAARAGENGKGFAVVAEEVGNLASMSGNAAQEITAMLDNSIKRVEGIVKNSQERIEKLVVEGKVKVDTGTRIANECGNVLNEIVVSVASVSKMAMEIANASQEQASGVHEITKAMAQLDQVTQQNSATTAQTASAAESLSTQAENLNMLVQDLVITVEGANQNLRSIDTPKTASTSEVTKVIKEKPTKDKVVPIRKSEKKIVASSQPEAATPLHNDDRFADV